MVQEVLADLKIFEMIEVVCPPVLPWPAFTYVFLIINCLGFVLTVICLIIIQVPAGSQAETQRLSNALCHVMLVQPSLGTHSKKITVLFGNFSKVADPPPFWEPLIRKKKLSFILYFRPLGTFLVFTKKLKFCHYFYIYF